MLEATPDFVWIVPKESRLGRRLGTFTPFGLKMLRSGFELCFEVEVQINEPDEPTVHNGVWLDFPRYEISFDVQRLAQIHAFEQLAFDIGTPEPEQ
jgi:hypothetical protein